MQWTAVMHSIDPDPEEKLLYVSWHGEQTLYTQLLEKFLFKMTRKPSNNKNRMVRSSFQ